MAPLWEPEGEEDFTMKREAGGSLGHRIPVGGGALTPQGMGQGPWGMSPGDQTQQALSFSRRLEVG